MLCMSNSNIIVHKSSHGPQSFQDQLESFFLGLLEGDGSIQVNHWRKASLQYRIIIKLNNTEENYRMLTFIHRKLNIGNVKITAHGTRVSLVEDHRDRIPKIMGIIEKHGLRLTKARIRYGFFQYAFQNSIGYSEYLYLRTFRDMWEKAAYAADFHGRAPAQHSDFSGAPHPLLDFFKMLTPYKAQDILQRPHFVHWLCGIIEAEGCFSFRKSGKSCSFSLAQKYEEAFLLAVKQYFQLPNRVRRVNSHMYMLETFNVTHVQNILEFCRPGSLNALHKKAYAEKRVDSFGLLGSKETQRQEFEKRFLLLSPRLESENL
uniref:Putative LAGLIDADG homing endonuclease n=1 Tax=Monomastix sp. (strain OKE-1) TaxID=141716 RepID=U5YGE7_MONSK|nr:putative LAGLIDADG homing endonuclease [Monomastix sp. OKE-1]AGZ90190.1 putative LAGLIDADG homing endonuclease [Monomastix sp. OKE-1]